MPAQQFQGMPDFPRSLRDFKPTGQRYVLAARCAVYRSAAPSRRPTVKEEKRRKAKGRTKDEPAAAKPDAAKQPALKPHLAKSTAPLNAIGCRYRSARRPVLGSDPGNFYRRVATPNANNGDFAINAIENLSGSDALIGLRSCGVSPDRLPGSSACKRRRRCDCKELNRNCRKKSPI